MASTKIDYVDTYFELSTLTRIHREPNYDALKTLKNELKTNATQVTTDLGGGNHEHLGLFLTPAEYAAVLDVPYNCPGHPRTLNITAGTP